MSTTTDDTTDSLQSGIARLQAGTDLEADDPPFAVHGIAIPDGAVTMGRSGVSRVWPSEALREAAGLLEGRPIVKNFHELEGQAPADDVIGEVRRAAFRDSLGIVFEGEITDREIAEKIANGFLEVSPVTLIADETPDADGEQFVVNEIAGFRDIAVVAEGAGQGNEIDLGESDALAALSAEALSAAFADPGDKDQPPSGDDGTTEAAQSTDGPAGNDEPADPPITTDNQSMTDEPTDDERALLAAADDVEDPKAVLAEYGGAEEPRIVEQNELDAHASEVEALEADIDELASVFREALMDSKDLTESTVEALPIDALTDEFRNDEGDIEVDALTQAPETGNPPAGTETEAEERDALASDLGFSDADEAVETLQARHERYSNAGWESNAAQAADQLEALGAEVR